MSDAINPDHYQHDPSGIECIQVTRHRNFNIGNAIKYLWRAGLKDRTTHVEDLRKAIWYIEDEIARLEAQPAPEAKIVKLQTGTGWSQIIKWINPDL